MRYIKYGIFFLIVLSAAVATGLFYHTYRESERENSSEKAQNQQLEKGYDLPVSDTERKRVCTDCLAVIKSVSDIYGNADKGKASNVLLSSDTLDKMQQAISTDGYSVITTEVYDTMSHYEKMDNFLKNCISGKKDSAVVYCISAGGEIVRKEYTFDGENMYLLTAGADWTKDNIPIISYLSYTRINRWNYTQRGWFCYELCVPQMPEVSEPVDGSERIRVLPMSEQYKELSEKYVYPLGYKGNNLLCSDWDMDGLSTLDYNGVYTSFYEMKYGKAPDLNLCSRGIPEEDFENVISTYLPVTAEELKKWAVYDEKTKTYVWAKLGCGNYDPSYFGSGIPEVTDVEKNKDGTITLTVQAVCSVMITDDAVITHELTIQPGENGEFQYIGNKILSGTENIPDYQYRVEKNDDVS